MVRRVDEALRERLARMEFDAFLDPSLVLHLIAEPDAEWWRSAASRAALYFADLYGGKVAPDDKIAAWKAWIATLDMATEEAHANATVMDPKSFAPDGRRLIDPETAGGTRKLVGLADKLTGIGDNWETIMDLAWRFHAVMPPWPEENPTEAAVFRWLVSLAGLAQDTPP